MMVTLEQRVGWRVLREWGGTIYLSDRIIVFMPRWFYGLALLFFLGFGFGLGWATAQ